MMKHSGDWDEFDDIIIAHRSIEQIPVELDCDPSTIEQRIYAEVTLKRRFTIEITVRVFFALSDAGGSIVGDIIVLNDTTEVD